MIWGAALLLVGAVVFASLGLALLVWLVILPLPTAVLFRLAALIQRAQPVSVSDAWAWRSVAKRGIGAGLFVAGGSLVLIYNVIVGFSSNSVLGWALATSAFWGLVILWFVSAALWPLLFDPERKNEPIRGLIKLAGVVILVKPGRYVLLMLVVGAILLISTILVAAIVTISMAFAALLLAGYTIPTADRIEGRRTFVVIS